MRMSARGCDYKSKAGTTYILKVEREGDVSDLVDTTKEGRDTYVLELEREGDMSDRGSECKMR